MISAMTTRTTQAYDSPLRRQQAERTRQLILQSLAEQLADTGLRDFSVARVARRAGVSVRTVYHHFPDRDALLDALVEWLHQALELTELPVPQRVADLPGHVERLYSVFDSHEDLVRTRLVTPLGRSVRQRDRSGRLEHLKVLLEEVTDRLDPDEARMALALVHHLTGSEPWRSLKDDSGLDGREAGRAVAWAVRTLVGDLRRRNAQASAGSAQEAPE